MFAPILQLIEKYDTIVIFGHIYPDGDCYGSQIGLRETLRLAYPNKKIYAVGSGFHRFHQRIGEMDVIEDSIIKDALAIIVDANDLPRMEDQRVVTAKAWAKIDHHVDAGTFIEGPQYVDETANSCCEIITRLVIQNHLPVNKTVAEALFLGILTDTGRFQFGTDYVSAFKEAAWLCEQGANPNILNKILNLTYEPLLAFKGYVFSNYVKSPEGLIYLVLSKDVLEHYKLSASKAGGFVNLLSSIYGYPIWAFFCENLDGSIHCEFRSNGPAVQPIAAKYGGGGHTLASGATLHDPTLMEKVIKDLTQAVHEYRESKKNVGKGTTSSN